MASIVNRNGNFYVVFSYTDERGKKKQKWESCQSEADANRRKKEIKFKNGIDQLTLPKCRTITELLEEYVAIYGKNKWSLSVYTSSKSLIKNYITPFIGEMKISEVSARVLERYYGSERVTMVLAATIQTKSWDGRFSPQNKDWAFTI